MNSTIRQIMVKGFRCGLAVVGGLFLVAAVLLIVGDNSVMVHADPIAPPEGYPKFSLSVKTVTPTLAATGGVTLYYAIEIHNTGAYTAFGATLTDVIPDDTAYNGDAQVNVSSTLTFTDGTLMWKGDVGFDATVVVSFSVAVDGFFSGTVRNTAVISHSLIAYPVTKTAEMVVTDRPILAIEKTSTPLKPGANHPLVYTLVVANQGQSLVDQPITVTDRVPLSTTLLDIGVDGFTSPISDVITWTRQLTLGLDQETVFTFSVTVDDVFPGTVITNAHYRVDSPLTKVASGEPYTVTIVEPDFRLSKHVWPDPPGSNREMTYTLELLNVGSLATNLVITDRVPAGVSYVRGGTEISGTDIISWSLPRLDTDKSAEFTYTVYISDVMGISLINDDYGACSAEGICEPGKGLTSVVKGPIFETFATLNPFVKKPGAGVSPVTPTLVVHNLGPGNAFDAMAILYFDQVQVPKPGDIVTIVRSSGPTTETLWAPPENSCGVDCKFYFWEGDLGYGETITFTIPEGTNTTTGDVEGRNYTITIVITDNLSGVDTVPITATAVGTVTLKANLLPTKSASPVIGRGSVMTYTIGVYNSGVTVDTPPYPYLWEVLPISGVTVITGSITHSGTIQTVLSGTLEMTVISWTLPALSTGERLQEARSFAVRVADNLVSGTQIVNNDYRAFWHEAEDGGEIVFNAGQPVKTIVKEVGLIDSYKEVTPALASPGPDNVLTYTLHIVNLSPLPLNGVTVYDYLPWQSSTYQRNAVASAGDVVSDVVSIQWMGDVAPLSSEVITFTVLVDPDYQGAITNTAVISHPELANAVKVQAIAYITEKPVLQITKSASPNPVDPGTELAYTIRVVNRGQQATTLVITDTIPANTEIVTASITAGGEFDEASGQVRWESDFLAPGKSHTFGFHVTVGSGNEVVNDHYIVRCAEGVVAEGEPVVTRIAGGGSLIYLPLVSRNAP